MTSRRVAVVGSANLDVVAFAPRAPGAGETVLGSHFVHGVGGKGANQALAAAKVARTAFVGAVGQDEAASEILQALGDGGVDTSFVKSTARPTGRAFITVSSEGENRILVIPEANSEVTPVDVTTALAQWRPAVVLSQLETPMPAVDAASEWAEANHATFVLNPSPIRDLDPALLKRCSVLIVNVHEARQIVGRRGASLEAPDLVHTLLGTTKAVIITDGPYGAFLGRADLPVTHVPAVTVPVRDTTGAGDEFAGVVGAALAAGASLEEAVTQGNAAASSIVGLSREEREQLRSAIGSANGLSERSCAPDTFNGNKARFVQD